MYANKPKGVNLKEWSKKTDFSKLPERKSTKHVKAHSRKGKPVRAYTARQIAKSNKRLIKMGYQIAKQSSDLTKARNMVIPLGGFK